MSVSILHLRVINVLTDLASHLTQDVRTFGHCSTFMKTIFLYSKKRGEATYQSYYIEAVYLLFYSIKQTYLYELLNFEKKPRPRFCDYFWSVKMISIDSLDAWFYFTQRVRNQVNQKKSFSLIKNNHRTLVKVFFSKFAIHTGTFNRWSRVISRGHLALISLNFEFDFCNNQCSKVHLVSNVQPDLWEQ